MSNIFDETADLIPAHAAVAAPLAFSVLRELEESDLRALQGAGAAIAISPLKRIRAIHHRMALLLSQGLEVRQVAAIVGFSPQRVSDLQNHDPAFQDLLSYYKDQIITAQLEDAARFQLKIRDVGEMALDELRDRFDDDERRKSISTSEVRQVATFAADRSVAPPKATVNAPPVPAHITLNFGTAPRMRDIAATAKDITPHDEDTND